MRYSKNLYLYPREISHLLLILQFCSCKNTCSKGSGRQKRGCPCRDEGLRCVDTCNCGTKKASCKNKERSSGEVDPQNTDAGRNAFERHQITMEKAKQQISVSVFHIHNATSLRSSRSIFRGRSERPSARFPYVFECQSTGGLEIRDWLKSKLAVTGSNQSKFSCNCKSDYSLLFSRFQSWISCN